jgi:archaellum component FlaC
MAKKTPNEIKAELKELRGQLKTTEKNLKELSKLAEAARKATTKELQGLVKEAEKRAKEEEKERSQAISAVAKDHTKLQKEIALLEAMLPE